MIVHTARNETSFKKMWTTTLLLFCMLSGDLYAVIVTTDDTVVSHEGSSDLILPCKYTLDAPVPNPHIIRWNIQLEPVIVRDSMGRIFTGPRFTQRARFGNGCSLVLSNPSRNDSGWYTVKVIAAHDEVHSATARTRLLVADGATREITAASMATFTSREAVIQNIESSADDSVGQYTTTLLVMLSLWAVYFALVLVYQGFLLQKGLCQQGKKNVDRFDLVRRILYLLFLIAGVVVVVVGIALPCWDCVSGGLLALCLTVGIQWIYERCMSIRRTLRQEAPKTEQEEKLNTNELDQTA